MSQADTQRRLTREVNDRISALLREEGLPEGEFLCECTRVDCTGTVTMSLDAYESLGDDRTPLVAHGPRDPRTRRSHDEATGSLD
jgi:hypothetical protein